MATNEQDLLKELYTISTPIRELSEGIAPTTPDSKYSMVKQDGTINALTRVNNKTGVEKQDFTPTGIIRTQNGKTDLQVIIQECEHITLKPSTSKLLRILTGEFAKNEAEKLIKIPLKEYMERTGLKNEKKARKKVKEDLEALYNISVEAYQENYKGETEFIKFRILDMQGIKNGVILMNLSDSIATHLRQCELMPYSEDLLKIESNDKKNPYAYYLGDKVMELMKMNQYDRETGKKKECFITTVRTLLEVCKKTGMPSYEEVQNTDRQVNARIIEPFERDLDRCSENIFEWEYCNEKGTPLTEEQMETETQKGKYNALKYKDWEDLSIKITFKKEYPIAEVNKRKLRKKHKEKNKKKA